MCGRFVRSSTVERLAGGFRLKEARLELPPAYNIAPSEEVAIIRNSGGRQLLTCRWGFVPPAKDSSAGGKTLSLINARAETVATRPAFRDAFLKQRCLVVADGFYEWQKEGGRKKPFYVRLRSGRPFGFAGLYSTQVSSARETVCTCAIITTAANELLEPIHDRMPAIIPGDKEDLWLDPAIQDAGLLRSLLRPYPPDEMELHEVSPKVNSPGFNSPDAILPLN